MRTFGALVVAFSILSCAQTAQRWETMVPWVVVGLVCYVFGMLREKMGLN